MIVEADHRLHATGEQFVFRIDARRLRQQLHVQAFVLEVPKLFGQARRKIDKLGHSPDHDGHFFGAHRLRGACGLREQKECERSGNGNANGARDAPQGMVH